VLFVPWAPLPDTLIDLRTGVMGNTGPSSAWVTIRILKNMCSFRLPSLYLPCLRILRVIAVLPFGLAFMFFLGCAQNQREAKSGPVHIEVWTMWTGDEESDFEQVVKFYNKTHPGVVVENVGTVDDAKTIRAIIAGVPPDLCTLADPSDLGTLAANKAIDPLDNEFQRSGLHAADYTGGSLGICTYQGHIYGLPYLLDCTALMYNKDVFRSAGLDPDRPPATMEEMLDDCRKITKYNSDGNLVRIGLQPVDIQALLSIYGGGFADPKTGRITADNKRNVEAVAFYKRIMLAQGGYQALGESFASSTGSFNPFFLGQFGMMFGGEWMPYWAFQYSPNTHYGVVPLPYPSEYPDRKGSVWLGGNPFCIPTGSAHRKEAWDFLLWTQSVPAQEMLAERLKNIPNIRTALADPKLRAGAPWCPYFTKFMDLADSKQASFFPPSPVASFYTNQLNTAIDGVCYGHGSPSQALAAVQSRVEHELDQYHT
jgi:multiple sugar transport system substrate-binding protein